MKLTLFSRAQKARIHEASLDVLATVGVELPHPETLERFAVHGARIDRARNRVFIPAALVERCLATAGKRFTLYGRDKSRQAHFGKGRRNYNSIAGEALWLEEDTMERRYAKLDDVVTAARLGDALSGLNIVGAMADPSDAPRAVQDVLILARLVKNTTKPVTFWFGNRKSGAFISEMLIALAGSEKKAAAKPLTYNFLEPISPLRFAFNGVDLLYEFARFPLPVSIGPMAQAGATGPVTLAGTLVQENAEILAGVCVTQLVREGTPVVYGGIPHTMDMRTTQMVFAGPEQALMAVGMVEMAKFYKLPVYINVGLTDSKIPDAQGGLECGMTLLAGALAGADIFGHMGICGVDQATSLSMLVMQNEIIEYVERVMRGVDVNDTTLAVDVIKEVAPRPGATYIAEPHTAENLRAEHWFPKLLDRQFFAAWRSDGMKDMAARCKETKERLLAEHQVEPLDPKLEREIDRIAAAAVKSVEE
jgi:trimethylamine---corrinoid protein Co-methyltransferase